MLSPNLIIAVSLAYVAVLFLIAWRVDDRAARPQNAANPGPAGWLASPLVYTLSLSVYCTAWTFYGAVGSAARNGLEYAAIYLGPTLVFVGWWWFLRKVALIGRSYRITSIADMLSSRYGKSSALGAVASIVAITATTPYIALQLQSVSLSFEAMTGVASGDDPLIAFWVTIGMAAFTMLFGARTLDENERHFGVVAAIAVEAVVKLAALVAVGLFTAISLSADSPGQGLSSALGFQHADRLHLDQVVGPRWMTLMVLSAAAIICLPRQFHVTVVEHSDDRRLATASWLFPLYLFILSVCVLPIAAAGLATQPEGANPDLFVLTVPLAAGAEELAILAFIGGFSSATSMVIVSTIALSTMVSNHIVAPIAIRLLSSQAVTKSGDVLNLLLGARRVAILAILGLGYLYYLWAIGSAGLASIGLIAFCGVAQFLPPLVAGVFWRGATRPGALAGLIAGFVIWSYALFLPSFDGAFALTKDIIENGPLGLAFLKPQALLGVTIDDPLVHATVMSLSANIALLIGVSLVTLPSPLERLQSTLFVDVFRSETRRAPGLVRRSAASRDLFILAQRILGANAAYELFRDAAERQGKSGARPDPTPDFIARLERALAGSVGAASAHAMVSRTAGGAVISLDDLVSIADETAALMRATNALAAKSREAEHSAAELRAANERLRTLDVQKDEFLSQVSHELRTPMTSVRSFAEILESDEPLDPDAQRRFAGIIRAESERLTRLLDEIRDLSFAEDEAKTIQTEPVDPVAVLETSAEIATAAQDAANAEVIWRDRVHGLTVRANADRLSQVFINLISNALKHNPRPNREVRLDARRLGGWIELRVADNGPGVPEPIRKRIFEKFFRGSDVRGAGLGLPISRAIAMAFGGELYLEPHRGDGACFVVRLPLIASPAPAPKSEADAAILADQPADPRDR